MSSLQPALPSLPIVQVPASQESQAHGIQQTDIIEHRVNAVQENILAPNYTADAHAAMGRLLRRARPTPAEAWLAQHLHQPSHTSTQQLSAAEWLAQTESLLERNRQVREQPLHNHGLREFLVQQRNQQAETANFIACTQDNIEQTRDYLQEASEQRRPRRERRDRLVENVEQLAQQRLSPLPSMAGIDLPELPTLLPNQLITPDSMLESECPFAWKKELHVLSFDRISFPVNLNGLATSRGSKILGYIPLLGTAMGIYRIYQNVKAYRQCAQSLSLNWLKENYKMWMIRGALEMLPLVGAVACLALDALATFLSSAGATNSSNLLQPRPLAYSL